MAGLFRVYARRPFLFTTPTPVSSSICHISDHWHSRLLRARRERPCGRYNPKQRDEVAAPHGGLPQGKDHELSITGQPVHRSKSRPLMSGQGLGCAKTPAPAAHVETSRRNCAPWSRIVLRARCSIPCWRIVFSTFRNCMSFHAGWVKLRRAGDVRCTTALPPKDGVIGLPACG